ncbi:MAG: 2-amino-4-hydroxy-6-hydroxymethyldihydropteridine diphosphokinase [Bacteroidales bacterium]|jgi:2-amino-4-hydroxy-6-hydroxymethyldihydropteridine diphosphokinase|nr:2-amino-4-hydroxy-6-hydroxymethyldihydropteridine diphosphokinase [Bacteroidales bacterium]
MKKSYLLLGSNIGDREAYLRRSISLLGANCGKVNRLSSIYESEPWGFDHPDWFLNQAVELLTLLDAHILLEKIQEIETALGRIRTSGDYEARTMDIDIIFYGKEQIHLPDLVVPHPHMAERMFVLQPLSDLIPDWVHPVLDRTIHVLKEECTDVLTVRKWD